MLMRKTLGLIGALLMLLVLATITGFQPLYWLLYVVVGGGVVGYLWAWLQSRGLETEVQALSPHPQVGHDVYVKVTVNEKARLPRLGLRARLIGDFANMEEQDFGLSPRGTRTWTVSGFCRRRGLNSIGSLAIVSSDPTGVMGIECLVGQPKSILVYPATVDLSRTLIEGQATGGELGELGQLVGHSPVASMVRQYAPGDSLSRIHWPTTARLAQLMTKEFEGAGTNEIWLFVDLHESVQAGAGDDGTEEYLITIAASLAKSLMQDGHAVGLVAQGDDYYHFTPRKDSNHLWALLKALALVRATGRTPLATLMGRESGNLGPGNVAMVVAPWPSQTLSSLLQFLSRRGILVVPIFLDTDSFGKPADSRWRSDGRLQMQDWAFVIRRGDDLFTSLAGVLDRITSY